MSPIKIQFLSDLHLEKPPAYTLFQIPVASPILVLAGDIGRAKDPYLFVFLQAQLEKFRLVFFLHGYHEPFGSDWAFAKDALLDFSSRMKQLRMADASFGEFVLLDQTRYDLSDEVTLLGCTLFSRIEIPKPVMQMMSSQPNDFNQIDDWTVEKHNAAHAADLAWLNEQVAAIERDEPGRKVVVVTHYSPTCDARSVDPVHANSPVSSGFMTDLSQETCWVSRCTRVWAFGHTHFNCDFEGRHGLRVVTNQRGYDFAQAPGFMLDRVLEI